MILVSKGLTNANPSCFPNKTPLIPISTRPSQIQSSLMGRNENENGAASCPAIRRLILLLPLACRAWTTRCMRPTFKDLTCTQADRIDLNRHVRTNTWQQKKFHRIVIMRLLCTHRNDRLFPKKRGQSRLAVDRLLIDPSKTRTKSNGRKHYLNRHSFYLPLPLNLFLGPPLCVRVERIFPIVVRERDWQKRTRKYNNL